MEKKLLSIVHPCCTDASRLTSLINQIQLQMAAYPQYEYEHLIVFDCHSDYLKFSQTPLSGSKLKFILSEESTLASQLRFHALQSAKGDFIIISNPFWNDPSELLPRLVQEWEGGSDFIMANNKASELTPLLQIFEFVCLFLYSKLSKKKKLKQFSSFYGFDRRLITSLQNHEKKANFLPFFLSNRSQRFKEIFFSRAKVNPDRDAEFLDRLGLIMQAIVQESSTPLRLMMLIGLSLFTASVFVFVLLIALKLFLLSSLDLSILLFADLSFMFFSLQVVFLALLGEYLLAYSKKNQ